MKICFKRILKNICAVGALCIFSTGLFAQSIVNNSIDTINVTSSTKSATCLECHGIKGFSIPIGDIKSSEKRKLFINPDIFEQSVHAASGCIGCHIDILNIPHKKIKHIARNCSECHEKTLEKENLLLDKSKDKHSELTKAIQKGYSYLSSVHAKTNQLNPDRPNANCWDCHGMHDVLPKTNINSSINKFNIPKTCGKCHEDKHIAYNTSVHGIAINRFGKEEAAVCSDCHTAHEIEKTDLDPTQLTIVENCGNCHNEEYQAYLHTYHGQVGKLGYTHTAKCFNCHNPHTTQSPSNPLSQMHINNRVKTCSKCHENATSGFATFQPHGNTHDFKRFPEMWLAAKLMGALLIGVFLFFWTHTLLWFYREYQDRKNRKTYVKINKKDNKNNKKQYIKRFSIGWRIAHLLLSLAVMGLVLTGTSLLYANTLWAPVVIKILGGPQISAIIHRICASIFAFLFFGHLFYIFYAVLDKEFKWFGPNSLLPRMQDAYDCINMFKWFLGKGERPKFDRFTYWEKFDYWAPFWGMMIIGLSGLTMWFPSFFASFLPGWTFNVATIIHADEAFLATVFLFTVHFFNCHFRPDKFPQDISMFTGAMSLEEYKEEHTVEYERLLKENKLKDILIEAPSRKITKLSKILGMTLIIIGITLLFLVMDGFIRNF